MPGKMSASVPRARLNDILCMLYGHASICPVRLVFGIVSEPIKYQESESRASQSATKGVVSSRIIEAGGAISREWRRGQLWSHVCRSFAMECCQDRDSA